MFSKSKVDEKRAGGRSGGERGVVAPVITFTPRLEEKKDESSRGQDDAVVVSGS